jgi:hypothetical protein
MPPCRHGAVVKAGLGGYAKFSIKRKESEPVKPIAFDPETDLAPIPFDQRTLELALKLKNAGLTWHPHVGCFVWDKNRRIQPDSPFPKHVYFILSLPRFIDIFGSTEAIEKNLIWVPTWHQARLLCHRLGISDDAVGECRQRGKQRSPSDEMCAVYELLVEALTNEG